MSREKKNQGGRPPRYEGEKSVRIGALIRPRYKHALELVSRDRGMTLGEVMELAISRLVDSYIMTDGKPLVDFVKPKNEAISRLLNSISFFSKAIEFYTGNKVLGIKTVIEENLRNTPKALRSNFENYQLSVVSQTEEDLSIFELGAFYEALEEAWKEGINTAKLAYDIKIIGAFYEDILLPAFLESNPEIKERIKNNTPPNEEALKVFMTSIVYPFDEKKLLELFLDYTKDIDGNFFHDRAMAQRIDSGEFDEDNQLLFP